MGGMNTIREHKRQTGFTIVELLIVIVIIAILASIAIVAYSGIQNRGHDTSVKNDVTNFKKGVELFRADHGRYPAASGGDLSELVTVQSSANPESYDLNGNNFLYCYNSAQPSEYAVIIKSKSGKAYYISQDTNYQIGEYTGVFPTDSSTVCGALGVTVYEWNWRFDSGGSNQQY